MEDMGVLIVYLVVFLLLCALLVRTARENSDRDWTVLFGLELLAVIGSFCAIRLFDSLPGTGTMPGLAWFAATLYSMGAVGLYSLLLLLSIVIFIWKQFRK